MRTAAALQFAVGLVAGATPDHWPLRAPHADGVPASFDCAMRQLAYAYGKQLAPRQGKFESLFYALGLNDPACKADLSGEVEAHPTRAVPRSLVQPLGGRFLGFDAFGALDGGHCVEKRVVLRRRASSKWPGNRP